MPVTYFTETEYLNLKQSKEDDVTFLLKEIKKLRGEVCNIGGFEFASRRICCRSCDFKGICPSDNRYFSN